MSQDRANMLPMDPYLKKAVDSAPDVGDVSSFIVQVSSYIASRNPKKYICVFRGEPKIYPTPCKPFLFRSNTLAKNQFFEKSLFGSMRQNKFTSESCYLDNAIDAQHGEFPSRLLDVSYNCLVALYFAVTPFYHRCETDYDDQDGMVFLFFVDEVFSPSAPNTIANYDAIVNRKPLWLQEPLFQKNHKFIDHTKSNRRIIAQQGAFIMFQGDEAEELPARMFCGIRIPYGAKPVIREQLNQLFGIHTGSIYPEINNAVQELTQKSGYLNAQDFTFENELSYTLRQLEKELDYYLDYALDAKDSKYPEQIQTVLRHIERVIKSYQEGFLQLVQNFSAYSEELGKLDQSSLIHAMNQFNTQLTDFAQLLERYELGEFSVQELKLDITTNILG